ncbi:MAG: 8-amino-7-oxononanoate synthase [Gammaproteobacteria bacterium]|nr:8-amino-7-oxononanoate synthase [Gammaproteobacteria bacterium]
MRALAAALDRRRSEGLYRERRVVSGPVGPEAVVDGRRLLAFCSNDYLGLAGDPRVAEAFASAARRFGSGSGAAHLVNGHHAEHHALEEELAAFTGRARALLFSTGYMANLGTIAALAGRGDSVIGDRLNHASLIDGARLSGARRLRYRHADPDSLAEQLKRAPGRALVATDGVFSMDGDVAPLAELAATCREHDARLLVDDAHGLGATGPGGRGSLALAGLDAGQVPLLVGTLGKAFGTFGAFVAGDEPMIETLIQHARPYIYTTALPPAVAAATRASLRLAIDEEWRRDRLAELVARFRAGAGALGLELLPSQSPIQALVLGDAARALDASRALEARGLLVTAIRPPTVPDGTARLRITFSAAHDEAQVDRLLDGLAELPA